MKITKWGLSLFGSIALVIFLELFSIFDNNDSTRAITYYVVTYLPQYVTFGGLSLFFIWLIVHFRKEYKRVKANKENELKANSN